jgi:hypothetical protein
MPARIDRSVQAATALTQRPGASRPPADPRAVRSGALALGAAAVVGVLAENVLRAGPPGAGLSVTFVLVVAALALLARRTGPLPRGGWWVFLPPALFAVALSWRASGLLTLLNGAACLAALALLARTLVRPRAWALGRAGLRDYAGAALHSVAWGAAGARPLLALANPGSPHASALRRTLVLTARALALAALPLVVFLALLTSADPIFARLADRALSVDLSSMLAHNLVAAGLAWVAAGYLYGALFAARAVALPPIPSRPRLNLADVSVTLGALDLLFLAFVVVQLRYLFGGVELVARTAGMTYAEYARRGFFELVGVTALALPLLLGMHTLLPRHRDGAAVRRAYRWLAGALLLLLAVVVLSAVRRMHLYQLQYGLTELRLYTTAFMLWIVAVLALFAATVLRERPRGFAFGTLASGWGLIAALDLANPDALIVRTNVARLREGRGLDARYLRQLSADAAPALRAALPTLSLPEHCVAEQALRNGLGTRAPNVEGDWRTWNAGRERAWRIARESEESEAATASAARACGDLLKEL